MAKLEAVIASLETGDLTLDAMLAQYEKGCKLVDTLSKRLNEAEKKIKLLKDNGAEEPAGDA